jgi:hypothetical protein
VPYLDQETIRNLDDTDEGECIEIIYNLGSRERMAIGEYAGLQGGRGKDWQVMRTNGVGIKLIDVVSITRVQPAGT